MFVERTLWGSGERHFPAEGDGGVRRLGFGACGRPRDADEQWKKLLRDGAASVGADRRWSMVVCDSPS